MTRLNKPTPSRDGYTTIEEARAVLDGIHRQAEGRELNDPEHAEWTAATEFIERAEANAERLRSLALNPGNREAGSDQGRPDFKNASRSPADGTRDAAMKHLDAAVKKGIMPADAAERVENLMGTSNLATRWAAAGSDPAYTSAFFKALSGDHGTYLWDAREADAYRRVEAVRAEVRGMQAGLTTSGGFQIPTVIDPAIRISSDGSVSPIRQLAETRQEIGSEFRPVTSAHVTNQWTAESVEVPDNSPTLASPSILAKKTTSFVPFSFEYQTASYGGAIGDLTRLLVDGYDQLTAEAFLNGNGTSQPQGLWTGLKSTASELSPAVAETFNGNVDVYSVQNTLPPRFQTNATWLADIATINKLSEAETSNGAPRYPRVGDENPVLLRKRLYECSNMRSTSDINPALTADNPVLIYGDLRAAYTIVDFAGSTVELVPHLVGSNHRPTGERGLLLWSRVGAGVVIANAVRALNVATAA